MVDVPRPTMTVADLETVRAARNTAYKTAAAIKSVVFAKKQ